MISIYVEADQTMLLHHGNVMMSAMTSSKITSLTIIYSIVYSGADQKLKTSKPRVTGLCEGNSPATGEFPAQRDSNAENVSIWWRNRGKWPTRSHKRPWQLVNIGSGNGFLHATTWPSVVVSSASSCSVRLRTVSQEALCKSVPNAHLEL